jgi:hypothetical protein
MFGACDASPVCEGIEDACTGCDAHQQLALCLAWDEGLGRDHVDYWVEDIGWPRYNVQAYTRLDCAAAEFTTVIVDVELERVDAWGTVGELPSASR